VVKAQSCLYINILNVDGWGEFVSGEENYRETPMVGVSNRVPVRVGLLVRAGKVYRYRGRCKLWCKC